MKLLVFYMYKKLQTWISEKTCACFRIKFCLNISNLNFRKDVRLPVQLQRAMAAEAEAAREARAKVSKVAFAFAFSNLKSDAGSIVGGGKAVVFFHEFVFFSKELCVCMWSWDLAGVGQRHRETVIRLAIQFFNKRFYRSIIF